MLATLFATLRLFRALGRAIADPATRGIVVLAAVTLLGGTVFYANVEGWPALDALYFSVTTLTTIGFGDLTPTSDAAKVFTIVYSLVGVGVIASLVTALALFTVEDREARGARRRSRRELRRERATEDDRIVDRDEDAF